MVDKYQISGVDKEDTEDKDAKIDYGSQSLKFSLIIIILLFMWIR